MKYVGIIVLLLAILIIKSIYNDKEKKRKLLIKLKNDWANVPDEEYTSEKLKSITKFYQSKKDETCVDDITWNDLDMNQIYMLMNNTSSAIGEEYLYYLLRKLEFDEETLQKRNQLMKFFRDNEQPRIKLQFLLSGMGKLRALSVYEYINRTDNLDSRSNLPHFLMIFGLILSVLSVGFIGSIGILLSILFIGNNIIQYYKRKAVIEPYFDVFSYVIRMLNGIDEISKLDMKELKSYTNELKETSKKFKGFRRNTKLIMSGKSMTGDLADMILDYVRMLFHVDLIKFNSMLSTFRSNKESILRMYETIGLLDSMIAAASFREMMDYYCEPVLSKDRTPYINVKEVYHPLIDEPVTNSISENRCVLITGSNASGKSTFIKTIAINAILSQTIYTSLSRSYEANYFKVFSSMALKDDIFSNESYYIVEIKSLKRILDNICNDTPILCFVDEVLRGTNTLERIAASAQILKSLSKQNALCFAATHDTELTHILEHYYSNYHFSEQIENDTILFDYKLFEGRAVSKNAIQLLKIIGYSDNIIDSANNLANTFLNKGVWDVLE